MGNTGQRGARTMVGGFIRLVIFFSILGAIAFAAAGTRDWPMMWAFLVFYLGMMTVNAPFMDPGLLEGYVEYAGRVRYRLIPGVW